MSHKQTHAHVAFRRPDSANNKTSLKPRSKGTGSHKQAGCDCERPRQLGVRVQAGGDYERPGQLQTEHAHGRAP